MNQRTNIEANTEREYKFNKHIHSNKDKETTTVSTDDLSKQRLPSAAKSGIYKRRVCRPTWRMGSADMEGVPLCSCHKGVEELLCFMSDSLIRKQPMRVMDSSQSFC